MSDLISRSALDESIRNRVRQLANAYGWGDEYVNGFDESLVYVARAPAVDAVPVVHARWVDNHCTACGMQPMGDEMWERCDFEPPRMEFFMTYCPNCGAKMLTNVTNDPAKPENCRYYTENSFWGGGCLGTKEIDVCQGENCERWKPKMDGGAEA